MCYQKLIRLVGVCLVLVCAFSMLVSAKDKPPDGTPDAGKTKWITVDCDQGQSINDALEDTTEQLYIEIEGICTERVVVNRDNVFLLGTPDDGIPDGITAPEYPSLDSGTPVSEYMEVEVFDLVALLVQNSRWIYVGQGLEFASGVNAAGTIRAVNSLVAFEQCDIVNSNHWGMIVEDSFVYGQEVQVRSCESGECTGHAGGILVTRGSTLHLEEEEAGITCVGEPDDPIWGIHVGVDETIERYLLGGACSVELHNTIVEAPSPVRVAAASRFYMYGGRLIMPIPPGWAHYALLVEDGSRAALRDGTVLEGSFLARSRAKIILENAGFEPLNQEGEVPTYGKIFNWVVRNSELEVNNSFLQGELGVGRNSRAEILGWNGGWSILTVFPEVYLPNDPPPALLVERESSVVFGVGAFSPDSGTEMNGRFIVQSGSRIKLGHGFVQHNHNPPLPLKNGIFGGSYLEVADTAVLEWGAKILHFSRGKADAGELHNGWLSCDDTSDFICGASFFGPGSGGGCGNCPHQ